MDKFVSSKEPSKWLRLEFYVFVKRRHPEKHHGGGNMEEGGLSLLL